MRTPIPSIINLRTLLAAPVEPYNKINSGNEMKIAKIDPLTAVEKMPIRLIAKIEIKKYLLFFEALDRKPSHRAKKVLNWDPEIDLETGLKTVLPFV